MATLYLTEQGATLSKTDERLVIRKKRKVLQEIPAIHVDQIVVFGNAQFTTSAFKFLMDQQIDVAYLSSHGTYRGRLQPPVTKNARLRQAQYKRLSDPDTCLESARQVIIGKLENAKTFCRRQRVQTDKVTTALGILDRSSHQVALAETLDAIRGYEGVASAAYYEAFRTLLKQDFGFAARLHHPPPDPINILLSLGYTLLSNQVYGAINIVGLDPFQGFFHQTRHGHATLASDLMEEWRTILVDSVVLSVVNREEITKQDFHRRKGEIILSKEGLETFLRRYDHRVATNVFHPLIKQTTSYVRCLELQVRQFAAVLLGEQETYRPFRAR